MSTTNKRLIGIYPDQMLSNRGGIQVVEELYDRKRAYLDFEKELGI